MSTELRAITHLKSLVSTTDVAAIGRFLETMGELIPTEHRQALFDAWRESFCKLGFTNVTPHATFDAYRASFGEKVRKALASTA